MLQNILTNTDNTLMLLNSYEKSKKKIPPKIIIESVYEIMQTFEPKLVPFKGDMILPQSR